MRVHTALSLAWVLATACRDGGCAQAGPQGECPGLTRRQASIVAFWHTQDSLVRSLPNGVFDQASRVYDARVYPAEAAQSFVSAYRITGLSRYLEDAQRQLQYARASETPQHLHQYPPDLVTGSPPEGLVSSLAQARLALGYYVAFKGADLRECLGWAEEALDGLLLLPRFQTCFESRCFQRHNYLYSLRAPYEPFSGVQIDPNHHAFIGLIMTLLYHEPQSRFHLAGQLKEMALEQLDAALVLMDSSGRLPLAAGVEWNQLFDTRYGFLTLFLVQWANTHWKSPRYDSLLTLGTRWVNEYTAGLVTTRQHYPDSYFGPPLHPAELYYRLPLIVRHGGDRESLERGFDAVWERVESVATLPGGWTTPFAILSMVGLSPADYWQ